VISHDLAGSSVVDTYLFVVPATVLLSLVQTRACKVVLVMLNIVMLVLVLYGQLHVFVIHNLPSGKVHMDKNR